MPILQMRLILFPPLSGWRFRDVGLKYSVKFHNKNLFDLSYQEIFLILHVFLFLKKRKVIKLKYAAC
jgi:hypothetical protein